VLRIWPSDPYVFVPPDPDPDSLDKSYGSGSSYCFVTFDFLSLKNDVNAPSKSNKQKNFLN
jgi:hypothetical protein